MIRTYNETNDVHCFSLPEFVDPCEELDTHIN